MVVTFVLSMCLTITAMAIQKENVLEIETKLIDGIKNSDVEFLDSILHDDLVFITPNGQTITKQMDLDLHKSGEMIVEHLVPTFETVTIFGNTATVTVVYETKGMMSGNPVEGKFRYLRVWQMFDDGLKVIGGCCIRVN